ncbi:MAG: hypothetical protein J2P48_02680 [Alphaproteobacteria bacterium]|nr:hypothetical protein [Alphaproteobacteria bacterium]
MILFRANPRLLAMLANGVETSPGQIVTSLPPEDLATGGNITIGREFGAPELHASSGPAPARSWSRLLKLHEVLAKTAPDILAIPEVAR